MLTQINIPAKSKSGILPQQGDTNTFQKDKSRQEISDNFNKSYEDKEK